MVTGFVNSFSFLGLTVRRTQSLNSKIEVVSDQSLEGSGLFILELVRGILFLIGCIILLPWSTREKIGPLMSGLADGLFVPLQVISNLLLLPIRLFVVLLKTLGGLRHTLRYVEFVVILSFLVGSFDSLLSFVMSVNPWVWCSVLGIYFLSLLDFVTLKMFLGGVARALRGINQITMPSIVLRETKPPFTPFGSGLDPFNGSSNPFGSGSEDALFKVSFPEDSADSLVNPKEEKFEEVISSKGVGSKMYFLTKDISKGLELISGLPLTDIVYDRDEINLGNRWLNFFRYEFTQLSDKDKWEVIKVVYSVSINQVTYKVAWKEIERVIASTCNIYLADLPDFLFP